MIKNTVTFSQEQCFFVFFYCCFVLKCPSWLHHTVYNWWCAKHEATKPQKSAETHGCHWSSDAEAANLN